MTTLYQSYYNPAQLCGLDPEFTPLNNVDCPNPELRERPIFQTMHATAIDRIYGYISWKWKEKIRNTSGKDLLAEINDNPDNDVYVFNPYPGLSAFEFNSWTHGERCHPGMLEIVEHAFPLMGLNPELIYQPMPSKIMFFGLYCAGIRVWWDEVLKLGDELLNAVSRMPSHVQDKYHSSANYAPDPKLGFFPFIHERLLSTILQVNYKKFRIHTTHFYPTGTMPYTIRKAMFFKDSFVRGLDSESFRDWNTAACSMGSGLTQPWADRINIKLTNQLYNI